jgi:hypothetical protein
LSPFLLTGAAASARGVGTVARNRGGIRRHVHRAARRRCPRPGTRHVRRDEDYARCKRHRSCWPRSGRELLDTGIAVNAMHPGWADTRLRTALPASPASSGAAPDAGGRSRHDRLARRCPRRRGPQRPVLPRPASAGEAPPTPHAPARRGP